MSKQTYYENRIYLLEAEHHALKKKSQMYSWLRLSLIVCSIVLIVFYFSFGHLALYLISSILFLSSFFVVVYKHNILEENIKILFSKIQVNKDEILFLNHDYQDRKTGNEYEHINPFLANDFNLFGKGSLFQYLNRCYTSYGKRMLANNLCSPEKVISIIHEKQTAIHELSKKDNFMQDFQSFSRLIPGYMDESSFFKSWIKKPDQNLKRSENFAIVLGCINIIWLFICIFHILSWTTFILPIVVSQIVLTLQKSKKKSTTSNIDVVAGIFSKYVQLFKFIENELFESEYLCSLQNKLLINGKKASTSLHSLFKIIFAFELQSNVFISLILNSLLLWDTHANYYLIEWKKKHRDEIEEWLSAVAEMEVLISFATFAFNNDDNVSYPEVSEVFKIKAVELGHPLMHPDVRVNNDLSVSTLPSIQIITGANMAGKSTFLRTLAVNLILGMNGAPAIAKEFYFSPCDIMSSIKIQDSLMKNESYFYAELQRLKDIIDHVKSNPKTLVILDEILRGTNTNDKKKGSLGYLKKLIGLNSMVVIATHDLSICELENLYPEVAYNSCFEVELNNDELFFDYKLKKGMSSKLNASFLMKKMDIID